MPRHPKLTIPFPRSLLALILAQGLTRLAGDEAAGAGPLFREPTFEELANVTITTVSKRAEKHFTAAASVHVITGEEIRRSGALTLPEALRLSPGVEVGQVNSRSSVVAIRGFNGTASNKLLTLIDGRSLYSQRFASTIWDIRDLPLEDVEQIEVIGGPGGTTWGANAVNGVINIISKNAHDTEGDLWVAGAGTFEEGFLYARHGFAVGERGAARVYVKAFQRDDSEPINVADNNDAWSQVRTGFRYDGERGDGSQNTVTGDIFYSDADQLISGRPDVAHSSGGHMLARRLQPLAYGMLMKAQGYIDVIRRDSGGNLSEADVLDLDLLFGPADERSTAVSFGMNYRLSRLQDSVYGSSGTTSNFMPEERKFKQGGVFLEALHQPKSGAYKMSVGAKAEYNDFTQWEFMPSVRGSWLVDEKTALWAAWSRAARIPSRFENDQSLTIVAPGFQLRSLPSPDLRSEILNAWELGWRWRGPRSLYLDVSLFYHDYSRLVTSLNVPVSAPLGEDSYLENLGQGTSRGAELQLVWRPYVWWQLQAAYTYLDMDLSVAAGSTDTSLALVSTVSPQHQFSLRSSWNLGPSWEVDAWLRSVAELPQPGRLIPDYETLDLRVGKQIGRGWEVSIVGQNLLEKSHPEFRFFTMRAAVARGFYVRVEWRH